MLSLTDMWAVIAAAECPMNFALAKDAFAAVSDAEVVQVN